jgi:hypothetical protein
MQATLSLSEGCAVFYRARSKPQGSCNGLPVDMTGVDPGSMPLTSALKGSSTACLNLLVAHQGVSLLGRLPHSCWQPFPGHWDCCPVHMCVHSCSNSLDRLARMLKLCATILNIGQKQLLQGQKEVTGGPSTASGKGISQLSLQGP